MNFKTQQKHITNARLAHARWIRRAKHLIEDLPVLEDMIPLDPTTCEFGKWYYSTGVKLKTFPQFQMILKNIEKHHTNLHNIYLDIYKIYFVSLKRSWLMSKLVDSRKEASREQKKMAYLYYANLEEVSDKLMKEFDSFELALRRLKPEDLNTIF